MRRRSLAFLSVAALLGCGGPKSRVIQDSGEFRGHRCVGVAPFVDSRGQGQAIADAIEDGLQRLMYEPVDEKALAQVLAANMPDRSSTLGIEALENIHAKAPVDAIVFGRVAPDWSRAVITVNETEMGEPILSAVLLPRGPKKTAFTGPDDVAKEALRVLTSAR
ncbi:MAG TPA: hypothetical protein VH309_09665 [Elusimicrobiota bacterium]|nr:hypothetical protein [Elusimicrobiota bacterium]